MWYNLAGVAGNIYVTAVSASPLGPFTDHRRSDAFRDGGGDFHLFEDPPTGDAYLIYTWMAAAPNDHKIRITRLDRGFRGSLAGYDVKDDYIFAEQFTEAPALFYRAASQTYYAVFGHCCCFCFQGSGLIVHTAPSPLGPWTPQAGASADVVCAAPAPAYGGVPTPGQGCLYGGANEVSATRAQTDAVVTLPDGAGGETHVYYGGRWGQSPDGIKGHEPQYVAPLAFDAAGAVARIEWQDVVSFQVDA